MPRLGIMSDIHSNLAALEKALAIFQQEGVERIYCAGDIVGYGAEPEACCARIRRAADVVVAGNHEQAVCGRIDYLSIFSPAAILGVQYSKKFLLEPTRGWLRGLPLVHQDGWLQLVHGSLERPEQFYYLRNGGSPQTEVIYQDVSLSFRRLTRPVCFVGHSHEQLIYLEEHDGHIHTLTPPEGAFALDGRRAVINAGSVGMPRTRDRQGCVVIFDTERNTVFFRNFAITPAPIPEWIVQVLEWPDF